MRADTQGVVVADPFSTILGIVGSVGFDAAMTGLVIWGLWAIFTGRLVTRREHDDMQAELAALRALVAQRDATISELVVTARIARGMFQALPEAASVVRDETP